MADAPDFPQLADKPKKRKSLGSKKDKAKKARLSNHTIGNNCQCTFLQCFGKTNLEDRAALIKAFNAYPSKDEKDSFLSSLITTKKVLKRRPTHREGEAQFHEFSLILSCTSSAWWNLCRTESLLQSLYCLVWQYKPSKKP